MKILVGVKRVVDYAVKIRVAKGTVDLANVKQSMNPFCEIAVEEAVRIKESNKVPVSDIVAVSIGPKQCNETLRTALAMGCDRGVHIMTDQRTDYMELQPTDIAKILHKVCTDIEHPDLILVGKQSIDSDCGHVGSYLGGLFNIPSITNASKINMNDDGSTLSVERETDAGTETIAVTSPNNNNDPTNKKPTAIITCDLRLNEPRYASLPNIMKAKKKKVDTINLSDMNISFGTNYKVVEVLEPPARKSGVVVTDVDDLIDKLRNEAKAIQ